MPFCSGRIFEAAQRDETGQEFRVQHLIGRDYVLAIKLIAGDDLRVAIGARLQAVAGANVHRQADDRIVPSLAMHFRQHGVGFCLREKTGAGDWRQLCRIAERTPSVLFSLLRPGTRIRPHHGFTNARLICHLPLIVPGECALRVGNQIHPWREGELVVFDDSMEHEAWNLSKELRVVLLFDIWRPELTDAERVMVAATLEAVSRFDGSQGAWRD